jgi:dTDP-4-amino-4,6-dideoxygalactose transaminase
VKLEAKITPRTKAVIPVHLFGQCADMDAINAVAKKHQQIVIEDACQAIGAEYKGKRAGSISDYGCFSFFPSKNLGCFGDGGIVTTDTAERFEKLKIFRNHGQGSTYIHKYIGGNFRIDALQAAILSVKLRDLDKWSEGRQRNAATYTKLFAASKIGDKVALPAMAKYPVRHIYNQFCILVKGGRRDELKQYLQANGVGCNVYYPLCLHQQECFASLGGKTGDYPVSERTAGEILALPIYPELTTAQLEYVVATIEKGLC